MLTKCLGIVGCFAALIINLKAELIWFDGSVDPADSPPGKLLSDNADYWGEAITTNITYTFSSLPTKPAEKRIGRHGRPGGVLINGNRGRGRRAYVGMNGTAPMIITFDFNRQCTFTEWDIVTPSKKIAVKLEVSTKTANGPWNTIFERSLKQSQDQELHRIKLPDKPAGRFIKMTIQAVKNTRLREIIAWGDSKINKTQPDAANLSQSGQYPVGIAFPTVTGIAKSAVSDREAFYWVDSLPGNLRRQPGLWFQVPTWDRISDRPLLPGPDKLNQPIKIVMARNETEAVAVALKNTLVNKPRQVEVKLNEITSADGAKAQNIAATLSVFGVIADRAFGNNLGPIFEQGNMIGRNLMRKYILNNADIINFPNVSLPPAGATIFWLRVTSCNARPGCYRGTLRIAKGDPVPIEITVLDVTLPPVFALVKGYSRNITTQFPFVNTKRFGYDMDYALDCGMNDWGRAFHVMRPDERKLLKRKLADRGMRMLGQIGTLIPGKYNSNIHHQRWSKAEDLPEDAPEAIAKTVAQVVSQAKEYGLDYHEWYSTTATNPMNVT